MQAHIIYRKELFVKGIIYVIICASLGVLSTYLLKSRVIGIILLIILVIPIPFMRMLLKRFTRKIIINLYIGYFTFEIVNKGGIEFQKKYDLNDLRSYCIQFPNERFNSIKFRLKNGKSFEWSFFQKKQSDEDVDAEIVIDNFNKSIKDYNNRTTTTNRIIFAPSFYA